MTYQINLLAGWCGFAAGALSGAAIGLFFHNEHWRGGYASFSRRLMRLGHIAFFGLGFLNLMFALTCRDMSSSFPLDLASIALLLGLATMSLVCFLSAWKSSFRHLFFVPAGATLLGIVGTLNGVMS